MKNQLAKINQQINRVCQNRLKIENAMKTIKQNQRTSRARALIQLGALLHKAGIDKIFAIQESEDLQSTKEALDKAATLLGCLMEMYPYIEAMRELKGNLWRENGVKALKGERFNAPS